MITIIFEAHSTSLDNENHISSGQFDVALSPLGEKQAEELGERYKDQSFDAIFCSDLQRSYKTAEIAFGKKYLIIKDKRLRECDYGDLTKYPADEVEPQKAVHIKEPFPNGESYEQTAQRMKEFLDELKKNYKNKKVMIIGHRATQFGLEYLVNGAGLKTLVTASFNWQPGWNYTVE